MTTAHSPLHQLTAQADRIAKTLKAVERGDAVAVNDPGGNVAKARTQPTVRFGVAMDDKLIMLEISWARIRETDERFLSDYIVTLMRREAGET